MPSSPETEPAPISYAQWKFAKYVAIFYHQAAGDGNLEMYFSLVNKLFCDRWPEENNDVALSTVCPFFFSVCYSLLTQSAAAHSYHIRRFWHCRYSSSAALGTCTLHWLWPGPQGKRTAGHFSQVFTTSFSRSNSEFEHIDVLVYITLFASHVDRLFYTFQWCNLHIFRPWKVSDSEWSNVPTCVRIAKLNVQQVTRKGNIFL